MKGGGIAYISIETVATQAGHIYAALHLYSNTLELRKPPRILVKLGLKVDRASQACLRHGTFGTLCPRKYGGDGLGESGQHKKHSFNCMAILIMDYLNTFSSLFFLYSIGPAVELTSRSTYSSLYKTQKNLDIS